MKKRLLVLILVLLFLGVCAAGTYAFFTTNVTATNVVTMGNIRIALDEKNAAGEAYTDPQSILPGSTVEKVVTVRNTGSNAAWIRICMKKAIQLEEGSAGAPDAALVSVDLNTTDWTERDGCYYYNRPLEPGATTEPLFTQVSFAVSMDNLYKSSIATIDLQAQAVQVENNAATVLEAAGWPAID